MKRRYLIVASVVAVASVYYIKKRYFDSKKTSLATKPTEPTEPTDPVENEPTQINEKTCQVIFSSEEEKLNAAKDARIKGNELYALKKFEEAIQSYSKAIELNNGPEAAVAYSNRAACYLALKKNEQVIFDCSEALKLNPNYVKALERRAKAFENLGNLLEAVIDLTTLCIVEDFKNEQAITNSENLLRQLAENEANNLANEIKHDLPSSWAITEHFNGFLIEESEENEEGIDLLKNRKYEQALDYFSKKQDFESLHYLGSFYYLSGLSDKALNCLDESISKQDSVIAHLKKALIKLEQGDLEAFIKEAEQVEGMDPKNAILPFYKGEVLSMNNDMAAAIEQYDRALENNQDFVLAALHKARAQVSMQNLTEAKKTIKHMLKKHKTADLLAGLGEILFYENKISESAQMFEQASQLDPKCPLSFLGLSMVYPEKAQEYLFKAEQADPLYLHTFIQRANLMVKEGIDPSQIYDKAFTCVRSLAEMKQLCLMKLANVAQYQVAERNPHLKEKLLVLSNMQQQQ